MVKHVFKSNGELVEYFRRSASNSESNSHTSAISIASILLSDITTETLPPVRNDEFFIVLPLRLLLQRPLRAVLGAAVRVQGLQGHQGVLRAVGVPRGALGGAWVASR